MSKDTIYRDDVIEEMYQWLRRPSTSEEWHELRDVIDRIPSAQPEIIRCKDCKHYEIWQLKSDYTDDKRYKPSVCVIGRYAVHRLEDWFCADAERRTDDE